VHLWSASRPFCWRWESNNGRIRGTRGITVTATASLVGMSAHEQQSDGIDGQVGWWLEHGRTVEGIVGLLLLIGLFLLLH
jgi:hypothetical protein